jgi:hypothetical protein
MDKFQPSILEYLGKLETGIMVLLSIVYDNEYYEATYFYTDDKLVLTVSEELEEKLGYKITEDDEYPKLISNIIKQVVPYKEMYNRIDDMDFSRWLVKEEETKNED